MCPQPYDCTLQTVCRCDMWRTLSFRRARPHAICSFAKSKPSHQAQLAQQDCSAAVSRRRLYERPLPAAAAAAANNPPVLPTLPILLKVLCMRQHGRSAQFEVTVATSVWDINMLGHWSVHQGIGLPRVRLTGTCTHIPTRPLPTWCPVRRACSRASVSPLMPCCRADICSWFARLSAPSKSPLS